MHDLHMYPEANKDGKPKFQRDWLYLLVIALLIAACGQFYYSFHYKPKAAREVKVFLNHNEAANVYVTRTIQDADKFVYFGIYTFTREDIRDALLAAKYRGLDVRGIVDKKQSSALEAQTKIIKELQDAGIEIVFNDHSYIMHLKTLVTDKAFLSGSYNWTASATDSNDEIIEVGLDEEIRKQYEQSMLEIFSMYK